MQILPTVLIHESTELRAMLILFSGMIFPPTVLSGVVNPHCGKGFLSSQSKRATMVKIHAADKITPTTSHAYQSSSLELSVLFSGDVMASVLSFASLSIGFSVIMTGTVCFGSSAMVGRVDDILNCKYRKAQHAMQAGPWQDFLSFPSLQQAHRFARDFSSFMHIFQPQARVERQSGPEQSALGDIQESTSASCTKRMKLFLI